MIAPLGDKRRYWSPMIIGALNQYLFGETGIRLSLAAAATFMGIPAIYVFWRGMRPYAAAIATGKPLSLGGSLGRNEATGRGVYYTTGSSCEQLRIPLKGARIVVQGFKIHVEDQRKKAAAPGEGANIYTIMHGDWFVLVDQQGRIRGYYDTDQEGKLDAVLRDAELLARHPGT